MKRERDVTEEMVANDLERKNDRLIAEKTPDQGDKTRKKVVDTVLMLGTTLEKPEVGRVRLVLLKTPTERSRGPGGSLKWTNANGPGKIRPGGGTTAPAAAAVAVAAVTALQVHDRREANRPSGATRGREVPKRKNDPVIAKVLLLPLPLQGSHVKGRLIEGFLLDGICTSIQGGNRTWVEIMDLTAQLARPPSSRGHVEAPLTAPQNSLAGDVTTAVAAAAVLLPHHLVHRRRPRQRKAKRRRSPLLRSVMKRKMTKKDVKEIDTVPETPMPDVGQVLKLPDAILFRLSKRDKVTLHEDGISLRHLQVLPEVRNLETTEKIICQKNLPRKIKMKNRIRPRMRSG